MILGGWSGRGHDSSTASGVSNGGHEAGWRNGSTGYHSTGNWAKTTTVGSNTRRANIILEQIKSTLFDNSGSLKLGRRHKPDYHILLVLTIMLVIGIVTLFSIVPALTGGDDKANTGYLIKQAIMLLIGFVAFGLANKVDLDFLRQISGYIFLTGLVLCFLLPIFGDVFHLPIATCALGACRWYNVGFTSFQPAELLKLGTVLFVASMLVTQLARDKLDSNDTIVKFMVIMVISLLVIVGLQKDLGTGVSLAGILLIQLVISGISWRKIGLVIAILVGGVIVSIIVAPHRMQRVLTFFGQGSDDTNYHINQAMIALGSGGLTGKGLGQSVQAFGWLPEAVNDSIFAIFGEMFGYAGVILLIGLFAYMLKSILNKIDFTDNYYLRLVLAGIFGWLGAHVVLNIGAMSHIIPLTGITLPFVSFGGTSLIFMMFAMGLVFSISHYTSHRRIQDKGKELVGSSDEDPMRWGRQRRPYNANRGGNR